MNKLLGFREEQRQIYEADKELTLGDVTTVNLTYMSGGVQMNVVPNEFIVGFDMRITPTTNIAEFEAKIRKWAEEAGGGIEFVFEQKFTDQTLTSVAENDPWYVAFMKAAKKHDLDIATRIFPAGTDSRYYGHLIKPFSFVIWIVLSRYIREVGIPAFGFSPMNNTPVLLHDHNEFLNEKVFLRGIDIFCDVISEMASVA